MKKIFSQYPKLFHQILLLFIIEHFCFSLVISDSYGGSEFFSLENGFIDYYSIVISILYLISGWVVDKLQNFRKGLQIGIGLLFLGWFLGLIGRDVGFIGLTIFAYLGHILFYLFCFIHVSLFFPVANDWKDFAFFLMLLLPQLIMPVLTILLSSIFQTGAFSIDENLIAILTPLSLGGLYYLLTFFQNLGYQIEAEEDIENEQLSSSDLEENQSSINVFMIGIVTVGVLLSFIGSKLGALELGLTREIIGGGLDDFIGNMTGNYHFYFVQIMVLVSFLAFGIIYMSNFSTRLSKQILKLDRTIIFLFALIVLNLLSNLGGNYTTDYFIDMVILFVYSLLILPMLLSILTHINLDENLGLWLAALFGLPTLVGQIINDYIVPSSLYYILPFIALGLLILFKITLKENKVLLKQKLDLDTPNRIEGEDDNMDLLDHLLEK